MCVVEEHYGRDCLVVVEGNRRLAALKNLHAVQSGNPRSKKWAAMLDDVDIPDGLFDDIPYILMDSREEVDAFLGFRHVTGIKEWAPAEKAQFIAYLINDRGMTYRQVMRKIGSKTEAVRRNYISYSLLLQMEDTEDVDVAAVESKFSVLFLSLRTAGVQHFLGIDMKAEPAEARQPIDDDHINNLKEYSLWLFGNEEVEPIVKDSRLVDKFGVILASEPALAYFRAMRRPNFDKAYSLAGGEESEVLDLLNAAAFSIEDALSTVHHYKDRPEIQQAAERVIEDTARLSTVFEKL